MVSVQFVPGWLASVTGMFNWLVQLLGAGLVSVGSMDVKILRFAVRSYG